MKYKYVGQDNCFCLELLSYNIKGEHGEYLFKGDVVDVPEEYELVINSLNAHPWFEQVITKNNNIKKLNKKSEENR